MECEAGGLHCCRKTFNGVRKQQRRDDALEARVCGDGSAESGEVRNILPAQIRHRPGNFPSIMRPPVAILSPNLQIPPVATMSKSEKVSKKSKKEKPEEVVAASADTVADVVDDGAKKSKKDKKDKKEKKEKKDKKDKKDKKEKKDKKKKAKSEDQSSDDDVPASAPEASEPAEEPKSKKRKLEETSAEGDVEQESEQEPSEEKTQKAKTTSAPADSDSHPAPENIDKSATRFIAFIGNLPYTATKESIANHFAKVPPASIRAPMTKDNKKSKGFAFIEFDRYDYMKSCLKLYHHSSFDDGKSPARKINVELT